MNNAISQNINIESVHYPVMDNLIQDIRRQLSNRLQTRTEVTAWLKIFDSTMAIDENRARVHFEYNEGSLVKYFLAEKDRYVYDFTSRTGHAPSIRTLQMSNFGPADERNVRKTSACESALNAIEKYRISNPEGDEIALSKAKLERIRVKAEHSIRMREDPEAEVVEDEPCSIYSLDTILLLKDDMERQEAFDNFRLSIIKGLYKNKHCSYPNAVFMADEQLYNDLRARGISKPNIFWDGPHLWQGDEPEDNDRRFVTEMVWRYLYSRSNSGVWPEGTLSIQTEAYQKAPSGQVWGITLSGKPFKVIVKDRSTRVRMAKYWPSCFGDD